MKKILNANALGWSITAVCLACIPIIGAITNIIALINAIIQFKKDGNALNRTALLLSIFGTLIGLFIIGVYVFIYIATAHYLNTSSSEMILYYIKTMYLG